MSTETFSRRRRKKVINGKPTHPGKRLNVLNMDNFLFSIYPNLVAILIEKYGENFSQSREFISLRKRVFGNKGGPIVFNSFNELATFFDKKQIKSMTFRNLGNGKFTTTNT